MSGWDGLPNPKVDVKDKAQETNVTGAQDVPAKPTPNTFEDIKALISKCGRHVFDVDFEGSRFTMTVLDMNTNVEIHLRLANVTQGIVAYQQLYRFEVLCNVITHLDGIDIGLVIKGAKLPHERPEDRDRSVEQRRADALRLILAGWNSDAINLLFLLWKTQSEHVRLGIYSKHKPEDYLVIDESGAYADLRRMDGLQEGLATLSPEQDAEVVKTMKETSDAVSEAMLEIEGRYSPLDGESSFESP